MGLVMRRASGTPVAAEVGDKQDKLHLITLQRLAVMIDSGLKLKYIIGSDEFGLHLFPVADSLQSSLIVQIQLTKTDKPCRVRSPQCPCRFRMGIGCKTPKSQCT